MEKFLSGAWQFLNSGIGFAIVWSAVLCLFYLLASKYNPFQEKWKRYEGSIITAIRLAEKQIPDSTPNAGLAKLDFALRFVIRAYEDANSGKHPSTDLVEEIRQGIQIKHDDMDRWGRLDGSKEAA